MAEQVHVSQQNLAQFQQWLLTLREADFNPNLYFDLPLDVILNGAPALSTAAQETLAYVVASGHSHGDLLRDANTMLNLADKFPALLGRAYERSGNSRSYGGATIYNAIVAAMEQRPFEKNIAAIYAMLPYGYIPYSSIGTGDISKTSKENAILLNKIYEMSEASYFNNQANANARELIQNMDMGKLINFRGASPKFRERINQSTLSKSRNITALMEKMDNDLMDEQVLSHALKSAAAYRPKTVDTTNAKTQAEKNANILPAYYTKLRDAMIRLVQNTERHDPNNYGREKALAVRFKEILPRMICAKTWQDSDIKRNDLAMDVYMHLAQRDILDGRAEQLTPDELQMVLRADKHNFFIRHIPEQVIRDSKIQLNREQTLLLQADNAGSVEAMINSPQISARDKKASLEKLKRTIDDEAPIREELAADLAQYDREYQKMADAGSAYDVADAVYTNMSGIQKACKTIAEYFKDSQPNEQEANLAAPELEKTIYDYITGAADNTVATPQQKSLPLLFGRDQEKKRREHLADAIQELNRLLATIRGRMNDDKLSQWKQYKGKILARESLENALGIVNGARNAADAARWSFKSHQEMHPRRSIVAERDRYESKKETLARATAEFDRQQKKLHSLSRKHLGHDQTGELTAVTDDMTPEEKRATRQKNKAALQDKLAARKKKPARNLREMLANADMDR
ncbi:MAG: hypothetical protein K2L25_04290 [Alphaproteobacteria bacterium]|nr:hypothetical protein [Alphaproteobacteria bacterium]